MRTSQAFAIKDAKIKDEIFGALSSEQFDRLRPVIEEAFKTGDQKWKNYMKGKYGSRAEKFFQNIQSDEF